MNKKLQPTLLALSLAACFGANATVYQIQNIDDVFTVNGTIAGSRSGFGVVANNAGKQIGGASGSFAITLTEEEEQAITNSRLDVTFQQQTETSVTFRPAKTEPTASNFVFDFDENVTPRFIATLPELIDDAATINSYIFGLNDSNVAVGTTSSAARLIADPDQSDDNSTRDDDFYGYEFAQRGMIIDNDQVITFEPLFSTYGGQSGFTAINASGTVVGYASVGINPASQELIDDRCLGTFQDLVPLDVCTGGFSHGSLSNGPTSYYLRAFSWQYNIDGQLTNRTELGILAEPINDNDSTSYDSIALDVNDKGIAVGRSDAFRNNNQSTSSKFEVAVVFKDGEIIDLMDHDNKDWSSSRALAINDDDLVIGSVTKNFSGFSRNKFFVFDVNDVAQNLVFPNDLKTTETDFSTNANAINNSNVVVGNVEIDSRRTGTARRTHGFIYDHNLESFQDINEVLTCSSLGLVPGNDGNEKFLVELQGGDGVTISYEADIVVVDANDIADDGTIMATALVKLPKIMTQWVNESGETRTTSAEGFTEQVVLDTEGRPVFAVDGSGQPITEQLPRAVVLKPSDEQACDLSGTEIVDEKNKRQAANFGWLMLLLSFVAIGRRKFSS